jgi:hypothetical protein
VLALYEDERKDKAKSCPWRHYHQTGRRGMYVIDVDQVGTCSGERPAGGGGRTARRTVP